MSERATPTFTAISRFSFDLNLDVNARENSVSVRSVRAHSRRRRRHRLRVAATSAPTFRCRRRLQTLFAVCVRFFLSRIKPLKLCVELSNLSRLEALARNQRQADRQVHSSQPQPQNDRATRFMYT